MLDAARTFSKERVRDSTFYIDECDLGLGIFANRQIVKDEIIFIFGGRIIDFQETKRRGRWECMPIQIEYNQYIDTLPPGVFINHSCDPNAGIRDDKNLVALRDIREGDEIRFDYSTTMEENSFTMECLCRTSNCRHMVNDFSTLPPPVQKGYLSKQVVMGFIARNFKDNR